VYKLKTILKSWPYLPAIVPFLVLGLLFLGYQVCFQLNLFGLQDAYYHSKYFRPYAELKQEQQSNQVVQLKDNRILLPNNNSIGTEIFNPYTKSSEMIPSWDSINVNAQTPLLTLLADGNVLATNGYGRGDIGCHPPNDHASANQRFCDPHKTPLVDIRHKKNRWIPFPVPKMEGHSITVLPDGQLLIIGGNYFLPGMNHYAQYPEGKPYFKNNIILYNPKTYESKAIGHLQVARTAHHAELYNDHEVLVFGGMLFYGWTTQDIGWNASRMLTSVEAVNFKTGQSRIIGNSNYPVAGGQIFRINKDHFLLHASTIQDGYRISEIFDASAGKTIALIKAPPATAKDIIDTYGRDDVPACTWIPKKKLICVGRHAVRLLDPAKRTDTFLDYMHLTTTYTTPIYVSNVGLLIFGSRQWFPGTPQTTVQIFNYDRYLKDTTHQFK